jgi:hypothetical protein
VKAAELHLELAKIPLNITFEVEDSPDAMPISLGAVEVREDFYYYIGFCEASGCLSPVDARLPSDSAYLVHAKLRYDDKTVLTKDIIIDPTPEGEYGKKRCS